MASWKDALGVIAKLAPAIGTVVGTPLAGTAITALESVFGIIPKTTDATQRQSDIAAAIAGATPDQLLALKKADNDFQAQMAQLGYKNQADLEALAVQDRASARQREIDVKDWTPRILAFLVVTLGGAAEGFALFHGIPKSIDPALAGRILGTIDAAIVLVLTYYFGSSAHAAMQARLLQQSTPAVVKP